MIRPIVLACFLAATTAVAAPGDKLYATANAVNVRSAPTTDSAAIAQVARGQELMEFGREGEWVAVGIVGTGEDGYIHQSLVSNVRPSGPAPSATSDAYRRFEQSFRQLNDSIQSQYGIRLFSGSHYQGDGIVEVTATPDWLAAPADSQRSSLQTVFNLWDAAEGTGLPIAVYVVDQGGQVVMRQARR